MAARRSSKWRVGESGSGAGMSLARMENVNSTVTAISRMAAASSMFSRTNSWSNLATPLFQLRQVFFDLIMIARERGVVSGGNRGRGAQVAVIPDRQKNNPESDSEREIGSRVAPRAGRDRQNSRAVFGDKLIQDLRFGLPSFCMFAMRILAALHTGQMPVGGITQSMRRWQPHLQLSIPAM